MKQQDKFSGLWNWPRFLRFIIPSIAMMGCMALYNSIDGFFVARLVGPEALGSLNIVFPAVNFIMGLGLMFAIGGGAIVGMHIGEGRMETANKRFTLTLMANIVLSLLLLVLGFLFLEKILLFLKAQGELYFYSKRYLSILLAFSPFLLMKVSFEVLTRTDGAPYMALGTALAGGFTNLSLDYLFMACFGWGIEGAAWATGISFAVSSLIPFFYFISGRSMLRLRMPDFDLSFLRRASFNGSSELVNAISGGVVTLLYNRQALKLMGNTGVAAIAALMLFEWLVVSVQIGAGSGFSPLISYGWGAKDPKLLRNIIRKSLLVCAGLTVLALTAGWGFGPAIISLFAEEGNELSQTLRHAVRIFSTAFLFSSFNIFFSNFFTAIGDGKTSAFLAVTRTLLGSALGVIILPALWGVEGLWWVLTFSDTLTFSFGIVLFIRALRRMN